MIKLSDVKVRQQYRTRVRYRLLVLGYAWQHGPAAAGRHYGISARTIRRWRKRWRRGGVEGLVPSYPRHRVRRVPPASIELIRHVRHELGYGAARAQLWLQRIHGIRLAMGTIQRVFRDVGLPRLRRTRKREPRQMKLFEKAEPGESIQVDVKYVKIAGRWAFQYTALDDCTRFRVLRLYRRLHHGSSLAFLAELRRAFPFAIKRVQCDHGQEFSFAFVLAVEAAGIRHRYISPAAPAAKRQGGAEPSDRSGGVLGSSPLRYLRGRRAGSSRLGEQVQLRTLLPSAAGPHAGRKTCRHPATDSRCLGVSCLRGADTRIGGSILTRLNR